MVETAVVVGHAAKEFKVVACVRSAGLVEFVERPSMWDGTRPGSLPGGQGLLEGVPARGAEAEREVRIYVKQQSAVNKGRTKGLLLMMEEEVQRSKQVVQRLQMKSEGTPRLQITLGTDD